METGERAAGEPHLRARDVRRLVAFALVMLVGAPTAAFLGGAFEGSVWRPGFDPAAFAAAPNATQVHLAAISALVASGWGMLLLPKGDLRHRTLGRIWICAMLVMTAGSLAIPHGPTWIAAYAGGGSAIALLAYAYWSIRRGRVRDHGRSMIILMIGLLFMTALALVPGRLLHDVLFAG